MQARLSALLGLLLLAPGIGATVATAQTPAPVMVNTLQPLTGLLGRGDVELPFLVDGNPSYSDLVGFNAVPRQRIRLTLERLSGSGADLPKIDSIIEPGPGLSFLSVDRYSYSSILDRGNVVWQEYQIAKAGVHTFHVSQRGNGRYRVTLTLLPQAGR